MSKLCECTDIYCSEQHTPEADEKYKQGFSKSSCLHTEYISSEGDKIVCAICGEPKPPITETETHQKDCVCNKCMTDEQYQDYLKKKNTSLIKWSPKCIDCSGIDCIYPLEVEGQKPDYTNAHCNKCKKDFDPFWDADDNASDWLPPTTTSTTSYSSYVSYAGCSHKPHHAIDGKTWNVFVGRKSDCWNDLDDFDIILNLTGTSVDSHKHVIPIPELAKWRGKNNSKFKEIILNWPDMGVVDLPRKFWEDLVKYLQKNKHKMLMFCIGGHGRTGTAFASLLVVGCGYSPEDAVKFVRENYCEKTIETWNQLNYVYKLAGQTAPESKERKDFKTYVKPPCGPTCCCTQCLTDEEYKQYRETHVYPKVRKKDQINEVTEPLLSL